MDPARVLSWVRAMGKKLGPIRLVGCEPQDIGDERELRMGLSQPVQSAVEEAVVVVEELAQSLTARRVYG